VACGNKKTNQNQDVDSTQKVEESIENIDENKTDDNDKNQGEKNPVSNDKTQVETNVSDKKPESKPEVKPETKPEPKPETKPEVKPESKPEEKPQQQDSTAGQKLLADFNAKAGSATSSASLAESISQNSIIPFSVASMPVEQGYLTGFGNAEIKGFKEGTMFGPVIGTTPFVGYVFILEDGTDASEFISNLKSNADLRWNICTQAEEMVAGSSGNKVFFVMCNKDLNAEF
jgi:hypothetical protein